MLFYFLYEFRKLINKVTNAGPVKNNGGQAMISTAGLYPKRK